MYKIIVNGRRKIKRSRSSKDNDGARTASTRGCHTVRRKDAIFEYLKRDFEPFHEIALAI